MMHNQARRWLEQALSGSIELGLAWIVILAFIRVTTRAGIMAKPLHYTHALAYVDGSIVIREVITMQVQSIVQQLLEVVCPGMHSRVRRASLAAKYL